MEAQDGRKSGGYAREALASAHHTPGIGVINWDKPTSLAGLTTAHTSPASRKDEQLGQDSSGFST